MTSNMVHNNKKNDYSFFFISDEKLAVMLNFDFSSYKFLAYKEIVNSLDRDIPITVAPKITSFYSYSFFSHLKRVYEGVIFGHKFDRSSYLYSFIVGIYFYILWKFGGGRRLIPFISSDGKSNYYGFYDLRFTPLAFVFSTFPLIDWFDGTPADASPNLSYFGYYNVNSIFQGPVHVRTRDKWLHSRFYGLLPIFPGYISRFVSLLIFFRFLFFPFILIFHFIFRPIFFWLNVGLYVFCNRVGLTYYLNSLPYDYFWKRTCFYYIKRAHKYVALEEQGKTLEAYEDSLKDSAGLNYSAIDLFDTYTFSRLLYKQAKYSLRFSRIRSFFSGYFATPIVGRYSTQTKILKLVSQEFIDSYKRMVLREAFSIVDFDKSTIEKGSSRTTAATSSPSVKPNINIWRSYYDAFILALIKSNRGDFATKEVAGSKHEFFVFVRRFSNQTKLILSIIVQKKRPIFFTPFYKTLVRRSFFIQFFDFKFSIILFRQVLFVVVFLFKLAKFFFVFIFIWLKPFHFLFDYFINLFFYFCRISAYIFSAFTIPFTFVKQLYTFVRLYVFVFFEQIYAFINRIIFLIQKHYRLEAYYSYFYFFRRYFFAGFFTRFFTREIETEIDHQQEISDLLNQGDDDFDSTNFEFSDYDIGFERPHNFDDFQDVGTSAPMYAHSKNSVNSSDRVNIFRSDTRNAFFEQLIWGWLSINYSDLASFFSKTSRDRDRFKILDQPMYDHNDNALDFDNPSAAAHGLEDEQYPTDDESIEEDDYEEFYYDPEFFDSLHRYYSFFLNDSTITELNQKFLSYRLQINKWHNHVSRSLVPIPKEFLLMPSHLRQPNSSDDWKILTLVVSSVFVSQPVRERIFASRNDVEFINLVWSKFSRIIKLHPDKVFNYLDSSAFEKQYQAVEKKFMAISSKNSHKSIFSDLFSFFFGQTFFQNDGYFKLVFSDFRFRLGNFLKNKPNFSLLDALYLSYVNPSSVDLEEFKLAFSEITHLDTLSVIFYLRFLADSDYLAFYNFINTPPGAYIWSKFELTFNLATKYNPNKFEFVFINKNKFKLIEIGYSFTGWSLAFDFWDFEQYPDKENGTFEDLFLIPIRSFYSLFNLPYDNYVIEGVLPVQDHPATSFGAGFDEENNWNIIPDYFTDGPTATLNYAASVFSDYVYSYFTDPNVSIALFPFAYIDFIEDVFEVDEDDIDLDIYDQYMLRNTGAESLDSIIFYVNEDMLNEDVTEELDEVDPSTNDDEIGFTADPGIFNNDDPETIGDLPFYGGDVELFIDDQLENCEDWEPEELDSVDDVAVSINRLFFGTLNYSSNVFPATDYRIYLNPFFRTHHSPTGYDLNYKRNLQQAHEVRSNRALVPIESVNGAKLSNKEPLVETIYSAFVKSLGAYFIRFYFYTISFFFNITFYTYSKDVSHLRNALIIKHFFKNSAHYKVPLEFSSKLKDWIFGYEDFYVNKQVYERFKHDIVHHGDFVISPKSYQVDKPFFSFVYNIPYLDFLFVEGRDVEYEISEFLVYSQQDYTDFDSHHYQSTVDLYDNSRFTELNELELYHLDDLIDSLPAEDLLYEEHDWDIGSIFSFSTDDFFDDIQLFNDRVSILIGALSSSYSLISDYYLYYCKLRFSKYVLNPFDYWNTRSNYEWARLAATYGPSVYFARYVFSLSVIFAIFIYSFFIFPRIFYWLFVHDLDYGFFLFSNAIFTFSTVFLSLLIFFPHFSSFYSSFSKDERLAIHILVVAIWFQYVYGGYMRAPWTLLDLVGQERYMNLSTEPDITPRFLAHEYPYVDHFHLESARSIHFFDVKEERELIYEWEKFPGDPARRFQFFTFDYTKPTLGNVYDYIKYHLFGQNNYYFTGYKYAQTNQDTFFIRQAIDVYHTFLHRSYNIRLGGLPRAYKRLMRGRIWGSYVALAKTYPGYAYSTQLSNRDEYQEIDPINYMVDENVLFNNENYPIAIYPYDWRPNSFYTSRDDHYSSSYLSAYGSVGETTKSLQKYNYRFFTPRHKIIFFKGKRHNRRLEPKFNFRNRRTTGYIYRYGKVARFKQSFKISSSNYPFSTPLSNLSNRILGNRFLQKKIKRGQFLFVYSSNFYKHMLIYNFPRSKNYIDIFTVRPSQLYPRPSNKRRHKKSVKKYLSLVSSINSQDVWSKFNYRKYSIEDAVKYIEEEEFTGNFIKTNLKVADLRTYSRQKTFYRAHLSRLSEGRNAARIHQPFFNFLRYSRFVFHYNNYIKTLYSQITDNYYYSLEKFADKYLFRTKSLNTAKSSYLSGIVAYDSKFKRAPITNSRFSRDRSRRIRRRYRNYHKDLISYATRFSELRTSPNVFHSNYSYRMKYSKFAKKSGRFYQHVPSIGPRSRAKKRLFYNRYFSNYWHYRLVRKRITKRRRRFFSKIGSSTRYQQIFNNYRFYRDSWLHGHKSFNRTIDSKSKAIKRVREHELKFKTVIKKLTEKRSTSVLTERFDVRPTTLSSGFLVNYYTYFKPRYKYYSYSPINHAFYIKKFRLLHVSEKNNPTILNITGFTHDDNFEALQDFRKVVKGIVNIEDYNRTRFFRAKKKFYKPFFYRYLYIASNRRYKRQLFYKRMQKKFSNEFLYKAFLKPVSRRKFPRSRLPTARRVYYSTYKGPDPYNPNRIITRRRIRIVRPIYSKEIQLQMEREKLYKKKLARWTYNRYKREIPIVKKQMLANSRRYAKLGDRYDIADSKRYYRKQRPRRGLLQFENKFIATFVGPRFNNTLAEAEVFIERERRRKKAAFKRLQEKKKQQALIRKEELRKLQAEKKRYQMMFYSGQIPGEQVVDAPKSEHTSYADDKEFDFTNHFFDENNPFKS